VEQGDETKVKVLVLEKQIEDAKAREAQVKQSNKVSFIKYLAIKTSCKPLFL